MPGSRHALCCSSPIPCDSAPRWHNSKITLAAHILPVLPAPHNTQLPRGEAGEPKLSAVSPVQAGAQGYSHEVTTAAFKKLLKHGELSAWSETSQCFSTPEHTPCCWGCTAHCTVWHKSVQNWPCTKEEEQPSFQPGHNSDLVNLCFLKVTNSNLLHIHHTPKLFHQAISHRWHLVSTLFTHKKYHAEHVICTKTQKYIFNHNECREFHNQWLHYCFLKSIYSSCAFSCSKSNPPPGILSFPALTKTSTVPHFWVS